MRKQNQRSQKTRRPQKKNTKASNKIMEGLTKTSEGLKKTTGGFKKTSEGVNKNKKSAAVRLHVAWYASWRELATDIMVWREHYWECKLHDMSRVKVARSMARILALS